MTGGGNKKDKQAKKDLITKKQITIFGESREKSRCEKRKN
jgi:hypothetical protein